MDAPIKLVLKNLTVREKLLTRREIDPETGCWLWTGARDKYGYGSIPVGPARSEKAYRAAYREFVAPIPEGAHVLHRCDNPRCINPEHLFLGDQRSNMADMVKKGRQQRGERGSMAKLTEPDVLKIRSLAGQLTHAQIARVFGVRPSAVTRIINRKRWAHL